jgi:Flp pilus assembly protein TadB
MEYPHWLMIAGAVLVAFGFAGFAFSQNKNESESRERLNARNKVARSAEEVANLAEQERKAPPTERIKAMREYASAAGGLKAKGK